MSGKGRKGLVGGVKKDVGTKLHYKAIKGKAYSKDR